mgnify:CR=1 FL=1
MDAPTVTPRLLLSTLTTRTPSAPAGWFGLLGRAALPTSLRRAPARPLSDGSERSQRGRPTSAPDGARGPAGDHPAGPRPGRGWGRPRRGRPSYGVLQLRLAIAEPETFQTSSGSTTHRLAGFPGRIGAPCRSAPPAMAEVAARRSQRSPRVKGGPYGFADKPRADAHAHAPGVRHNRLVCTSDPLRVLP